MNNEKLRPGKTKAIWENTSYFKQQIIMCTHFFNICVVFIAHLAMTHTPLATQFSESLPK